MNSGETVGDEVLWFVAVVLDCPQLRMSFSWNCHHAMAKNTAE
jgi:hypothetical protein